MTEEELERLATLIAAAIRRRGSVEKAPRASWLPQRGLVKAVVRDAVAPVWSGAAQALGDIAPVRVSSPSAYRTTTGELVVAARAAAAGQVQRPPSQSPRSDRAHQTLPRRAPRLPVSVPLGISHRHLHLSREDARVLFGTDQLSVLRAIRQPGQFAAKETVQVVGPKGSLTDVRVVGPLRAHTQLELARGDAHALGINPPIAASGQLAQSAGGVALVGPYGRLEMTSGVIIAARHLHLAVADGAQWRFRDGDLVDVVAGAGARQCRYNDVLVRCGETHATEVHLDSDEANAAALANGDLVTIVAHRPARGTRRALLTERDVIAVAKSGGRIPENALLTPSARDRARALGL